MSGPFESLELLVGAPGGGLAVPGRIQRLLTATLDVRSEEVGCIEPLERGRTRVNIALARSRRISTPTFLSWSERGQTSLWELRRPSDPRRENRQTWMISFDRGECPSPGQVATAIQAAYPQLVGAEELGLSFVGSHWIRVEVPERLAAYTEAPKVLVVGERKLKVEVLP